MAVISRTIKSGEISCYSFILCALCVLWLIPRDSGLESHIRLA